ncbi:hypothetical protein OF83DRAFT_1180653 [Amylostereum chailletii]|nr:hypothetical protein OF83DRAFT_1180653 [Amylostereum chailletii]
MSLALQTATSPPPSTNAPVILNTPVPVAPSTLAPLPPRRLCLRLSARALGSPNTASSPLTPSPSKPVLSAPSTHPYPHPIPVSFDILHLYLSPTPVFIKPLGSFNTSFPVCVNQYTLNALPPAFSMAVSPSVSTVMHHHTQ